jgi:hypothetical protein
VEEEGVGAGDIGPPLDNSTIQWKPPEEGIVLLELFGGIGSGLAVVLRAGIKVKRYVYVDVDDVARQVAKQHARRLRTQSLDLLAYIAIQGCLCTRPPTRTACPPASLVRPSRLPDTEILSIFEHIRVYSRYF